MFLSSFSARGQETVSRLPTMLLLQARGSIFREGPSTTPVEAALDRFERPQFCERPKLLSSWLYSDTGTSNFAHDGQSADNARNLLSGVCALTMRDVFKIRHEAYRKASGCLSAAGGCIPGALQMAGWQQRRKLWGPRGHTIGSDVIIINPCTNHLAASENHFTVPLAAHLRMCTLSSELLHVGQFACPGCNACGMTQPIQHTQEDTCSKHYTQYNPNKTAHRTSS